MIWSFKLLSKKTIFAYLDLSGRNWKIRKWYFGIKVPLNRNGVLNGNYNSAHSSTLQLNISWIWKNL